MKWPELDGRPDTPELRALEPLFERQMDLSTLPDSSSCWKPAEPVKACTSTPIPLKAGLHEGLGFLWATRLTRIHRGTITVSVNDYGLNCWLHAAIRSMICWRTIWTCCSMTATWNRILSRL